MNDKTDIRVIEDRPMDIGAVKQHVTLVQTAMRDVMKEGMDRHYGTIPGTQKPTLLQPGAQLIAVMFRLAPTYDIQVDPMGDGHREYSVTCTLSHTSTGQIIGQGVGSANTMEDKWRYRWDSTGQPVPQDYWQTRDPIILGGPQYVAKKKGGQWLIFQRVETDNPANTYNTVLKIAKKRAFVDAVTSSTAASDVFTSGDELENGTVAHGFQPPEQEETKPATPTPKRKAKPAQKPAHSKAKPAQKPAHSKPQPDPEGETSDPLAVIQFKVDACQTLDELQEVLTEVNALKGAAQKQAFHIWQARKDAIGA